MRRAVTVLVLFSLIVSALSLSVSAQSQNTFYLHASYLLDQNAPTGASTSVVKLAMLQYVWRTALFPAPLSFPAGKWIAAVWMNVTQKATQYKLRLGTVNPYGAFAEYGCSFTPIITSASPALHEVSISAAAFTVSTDELLAIGFMHLWQNESSSPVACIFFDSEAMPSSLTGPSVPTTTSSTTQTTTQQITAMTPEPSPTIQYAITTANMTPGSSSGVGWAFAVVGIGIGVGCAGAGVAVAASGGSYPEVFVYAGYYYCKKHGVPVWNVQGCLWCPTERRYLRP